MSSIFGQDASRINNPAVSPDQPEPESILTSDYHFIACLLIHHNYSTQEIASALRVERQVGQIIVSKDGEVEITYNRQYGKQRFIYKQHVETIYKQMVMGQHPRCDIFRYWKDYKKETGVSWSHLPVKELLPHRLLLPRFHAAYILSNDGLLDKAYLSQNAILTGPEAVTDSFLHWNEKETWYKKPIFEPEGKGKKPAGSISP
ncbi:MAG: hypothetical protein LQ344_007413 [Seirophora lacunosa]|nr:MAG: hypothetical protein LQ344_007413 [Seirophora lacunosa]